MCRKAVDAHMSLLINAHDAGDVTDLGVLRHVEIVQYGARSGDR